MRKQLLTMASTAALVLAMAASGSVSAGAFQFAPDLGAAADSNVIHVQGNIQVQGEGRQDRQGDSPARKKISGGGGSGQGASVLSRDDFRSGTAPKASQRGVAGPSRQIQNRNVQRRDVSRRNFDRAPQASAERRGGDHRIVRQGWSRDRKHVFYGRYLLGVPFGYAAYASHPCYDWVIGPQGPGYYWNYGRCPV